VHFQDLGVPIGLTDVMGLDDKTVTDACSHDSTPSRFPIRSKYGQEELATTGSNVPRDDRLWSHAARAGKMGR
jgi:hypothetical protein